MFAVRAFARRNSCFNAKKPQRAASSSASASGLQDVDVAIVGGGPAGLSLACALSSSKHIRNTLRIALIEGADLARVRNWSPQPDQFSNRVISITNNSKEYLESIGAWEYVDESRTAPIEEMHAWDGLSDSCIIFSAQEIPSTGGFDTLKEMARLTENFNIQRALLRRLEKSTNVSLFDRSKVETIEREDRNGAGWPIVHFAGGRKLRAKLLVGADGFNSPVRSYANISSYGWSYDTQAIVATLSHAPRTRTKFQIPNTTAYQRFLPTGPIAFLPLSSSTSSLVWSMKPPVASALLASDSSVLSAMVNAAFRLPDISMRYLKRLILDAHSNGALLSGQSILEEVKWREQSHSIDPQSMYSSFQAAPIGVQSADSYMLPPIVTSIQSGTIASFPVRFNHADAYIGEGDRGRTVLVGDAAHIVHPLAGQGLNMGLADVEALTRCVESAVLLGSDIGSYTSLLQYSRDRYFENHKFLSATDKLHKLYSCTWDPIVWARSVGLEVINELGPVKGALMSSAGARNAHAARHDASFWNLAASSSEVLAEGVNFAKLFMGGINSLARSAAGSGTYLNKR